MMLTELFVAATQTVKPQPAHLSSALKDVGIYLHELQPQSTIRQGFKKSSAIQNGLAISHNHIFTAQNEKAVVNIYNIEKGNQEATVPFPQRISSLDYLESAAILVLGTQDGKLMLWETATGRVSISTAAHLDAVTSLAHHSNHDVILSASSDTSIHVWRVSDLITFVKPNPVYDNEEALDSPSATFAHHQAPVSAVCVGHSNPNTNFAISASEDKVCFVWHIQSCQIIRTILLAGIPRCVTLDPADRAFYIGSDDGGIQQVELVSKATNQGPAESNSSSAPLTLSQSDCWKPPSDASGAALCIAITYDGTSLITGHFGGQIIRWDVAKHRVMLEISSLPQAVSNIRMLTPPQLLSNRPPFAVPVVTKPQLDLTAPNEGGASIGLPPSYAAQIQVCRNQKDTNNASPIYASLKGDGFHQSLLDDAVQALLLRASGGASQMPGIGANGNASNHQLRHVDKLEDELASLKQKLASQESSMQKDYERHVERMKKRDALGFEKRKAFFAAKKAGQDGDVAMKPFADQELALDAESDEEAVFRSASRVTHDGA